MDYFNRAFAQFPVKLRRIFLPFVIISAGTISFLLFMYWLLVIKLDVYDIQDNFLVILLMAGSPWIPLLIWFRKRLKLLNLNASGRRDPVMAIMMLNWIGIIIPVVIGQSYMSTAIGKVTHLAYMGQVKGYPPTKYYLVDHYYINKNYVHFKRTYAISGKNNQDYSMYFYVCVPVFDSLFPDTNRVTAIRNRSNDSTLVILNKKATTMAELKKLPADSIRMMRYFNSTYSFLTKYGAAGKYGALVVYTKGFKFAYSPVAPKLPAVAWLAVQYSKTISNHSTIAEKEQAYKNFGHDADRTFKNTNFNHFTYLSRLPNTRLSRYYTYAITERGDVVDDDPVILLAHYDRFEDRNGKKLPWTFGSIAIGWFALLVILFFVSLRPDDVTVKKTRKKKTDHSDALNSVQG